MLKRHTQPLNALSQESALPTSRAWSLCGGCVRVTARSAASMFEIVRAMG